MKNFFINKMSLVISMPIALALVMLLSVVGPAAAGQNQVVFAKARSVSPRSGQGPTDPAELEAFLDGYFAKAMEEHHIAGAAISVVKDGKLFFAKGYGYADVAKGIPVDPEQTIFRIGSIGKTLTWTAVMQLVERGKLDLEADVNTYLDFRIPDTYPQPITLKHLLTHTSGFEDRLLGCLASDASDVIPAREWLISHMSARVRPPGEAAGYANYNAMLAGYIVAQVSGQPYDEYIQEHIFDPLGMAHSTARSQMPEDLRPYASLGYTYADGAFQPFPDYVAQLAGLPSGFHRASVTDMARFLIAHMEHGRYSDADIPEARILEESTCEQMHSTAYAPDRRLMGMAYGFADMSDNGQWTLGHQGYSPPMNSQLLLLPDQHLGVFVAYNSKGAGEGDLTTQHTGFQREFFDHYYPAPAADPPQPRADSTEPVGRFVGTYRFNESSQTTVEKVQGLLSAIQVKDSGDGALLLPSPLGELRFVEVEPLYFRQVDGPFSMVFREDDRGRITHMFIDFVPQYAAVKLNWYETPGFNMAFLLGCVLLFLSVVPAAAIRWILNRRRSSALQPASNGERMAQRIILWVSVLNVLFLAGAVWGMKWGRPNELLDPSLLLKIALGLGVLAAAMTLGALVYTVLAWRDVYWGIAGRIFYTLVTVTAVAFVGFSNYWNLLGWRF
jgi:CubicO group peptidase (beta-lactamase class C family)